MAKAPLTEKIGNIKMGYRILILVGTIALMVGAFVFLVYIPKTNEIAKTRKDIEGLEQQINRAKIRVKNLAKFEAEKAEVERQFQEALNLLPNEREIPSLLSTITQLGNDANLEFRLFSPIAERPKDFYIEIPVSVEVSGTYHEVAEFFDKVGRMQRIVNIIDVSMRPVKEGSSKLITQCQAVTYRFKGKADETAEPGQRKG
jgi:type IV pilus assembly protein PilO